jgi:hypothetical protein
MLHTSISYIIPFYQTEQNFSLVAIAKYSIVGIAKNIPSESIGRLRVFIIRKYRKGIGINL